MLKIYLTRHGQDRDNANGILNGRRDEPLSEKGVEQARELAEKIKALGLQFSHVYTSPLKRAHKTAEIITSTLHMGEPEVLSDLIERDFGVVTGKPSANIKEMCAPDTLETDTVTYFLNAKDAETFPQLLERARKLLDMLQSKHQDENILLVTHGDFGKMIYASYYGLDWMEVLKMFHFGNSDLLELSEESKSESTHLVNIRQHNL